MQAIPKKINVITGLLPAYGKVTVNDISQLFYCILNPHDADYKGLYSHFISSNKMKEWQELILDMATHFLYSQGQYVSERTSFTTTKLGDVCEIGAMGNNQKGITIFIGNKKFEMANVSLSELQEYMVDIVCSHKHWYCNEEYTRFEQATYAGNRWQGQLLNKNGAPSSNSYPNDKSYPYRSIRDVFPTNLNMVVEFPTPIPDEPFIPKKIQCSHLALQYIKDVWQEHRNGEKISWALYSTKESIAAHVPFEIVATYQILQENAKRYDLINNDKFGEYVQMCFEDMLKPERKERLKTLLICSINHAMAIKLHIKSVKNNPLYVVSFYDPNITNEPVRCETGNLQTFKNHTLEEYINGTIGEGGIQGRYNWYFPESNPIAMVLECDLDQISNKPVKVEKKLTLFASDLLTPTHIYYLLANNFHHDLDQLWNRLKKSGGSSLENLFTLVAAKNSEGTPGLWWALQDGHAEVIKIYKKFLPEFCESEYLIDLLAAKDEEGTPALYMALQNGHTEAIKAYGELLQFADSNYLVELLAAKDEDGTPGLCMALRYGRADTIREYGKLIQSIPGAEVGDLVDILAAKASNEVPGLSMALIAGHGAAIEAYGELLQLLGLKVGDNLIKLLAAIDEQGTPGFYEALRYGHAGAIKAYGQLLQLLPSNERDELIGLLAAKKENGMSGLFAAFLGKHTAALKAYRQLLRQLSEKEHKQLFDLLGATSAMESEEVVEGYKELLQALSKWHAEFSTKK